MAGVEALHHLFGRRVQDFEHLRDLRNEGLNELAILVFFGVPEHAEHERTGWVFEGLDRVVFGPPSPLPGGPPRSPSAYCW